MAEHEDDSLGDAEMVARIEAAFHDGGMPDSIRQLLLRGFWDDEVDELIEGLRAANGWEDLPPRYVRIFDLCLVRGPVFRYFLPAIMRRVVRGEKFDRLLDALALVNAICVPTAKGQPPKFGVDLSAWTPSQRRCVAEFLRWNQRVCFQPHEKVNRRIERALPYLLDEAPWTDFRTPKAADE
ncbi:MAG TPA: hypothetical protein VGN57_18155 [Pirellulaceae bacterium]|jgi:hypothetical protein|nr:hypothetical protein [Pirellulaceae bacterium]